MTKENTPLLPTQELDSSLEPTLGQVYTIYIYIYIYIYIDIYIYIYISWYIKCVDVSNILIWWKGQIKNIEIK